MFFVKFKSEAHKDMFARIDLDGHTGHNQNMANRYGMEPFAVDEDPDNDEWWDTVDGDFTIEVKEESKYFEKVVVQ
ncbi:hypothetical protein ZPAH1_orf00007 [Aeromonas phage ZPAH1]|nr:hypothetical protein ZPAH1_orf00007 [Aeromonas phage ZPAH1]